MSKKQILIILTGGTISMDKLDSTSGIVITDNENTLIEQLKSNLTDVKLTSEVFSMKPSPSLKIADLFSLAKLTKKHIESKKYDGIVITHGTDTLEESAYFFDLFFKAEIPIVFTGSMRNFSQLGYDGYSNLMSSILVAGSSNSKHRGVLVVLNDEINAASEVTKSHTLALHTFKSLEFGPIGIVDEDNVIYYRETKLSSRTYQTSDAISAIEIVKTYLGSTSFILDLMVENGVQGIVVEALGRGNVTPDMADGIERAIKKGIPVVLTSRAPMGRVLDSYGYPGGGIDLVNRGVILAPNLNSQKARIKLMLVMGVTKDINEIKKHF